PAERLARLAQLERWHFWFVGRRRLLCRLLARSIAGETVTIADLGCGTGMLAAWLTIRGYRVVGLDERPEGLLAARRALPRAWLVQANATCLPLREAALEGALLLDVLEHVEERPLLAEVRRVVRPGGVIIVTVPAMPWLWGYRDEAAGHLRRYTRRTLARRLTEARLQVEEMRYYQCLLFPVALITRLLGRTRARPRDFEESPGP